jgi:hypothetical protein
VQVQIMPAAEAATYRFNPFDLTKVWPHADYPPIEIGKLELNRNPDNIFAEVEQAIFSPAPFVPGIGPSPDKMLQGRLFAYADAHRYRVGVNADQLPVNRPHATDANAYHRDGALYDGRHRRAKNYEPNSFGGPVQTDRPLWVCSDGGCLARFLARRSFLRRTVPTVTFSKDVEHGCTSRQIHPIPRDHWSVRCTGFHRRGRRLPR